MSSAFDWSAYLEIAENLVDLAENESADQLKQAYWRTAVSRTYYCAFHNARLRWEATHWSLAKHEAHDALIRAYRDSRERSSKKIAGLLGSLRAQRVVADYRGEKAVTAETAKTVRLQAINLLELLQKSEP